MSAALLPLGLLSLALFTRHPNRTNFIYDEQEALLANPYVRSITEHPPSMPWRKAFYLDFWGRAPEATIGSYRPIPNLIWRATWWITTKLRALGSAPGAESPFLCHWVNVLLHALVGAVLAGCLLRLTRNRHVAWSAGVFFVSAAILTEAVSGVVGLADVACGLAVLVAVASLAMPMHLMPLGVFLACVFGLFSKETALVTLAVVPLAALVSARTLHAHAPRIALRTLVSFGAAAAAFAFYVELRKRMFPTKTPENLLPEALLDKPLLARAAGGFLRWFAQPGTPHDTINNPLVGLEPTLRIAGALRVYARGLGQSLLPLHLAGDYSAPQEPAPTHFWTLETTLGLVLMIAPVLIGIGCVAWAVLRARRAPMRSRATKLALFGGALLWLVITYFPVSNIPVVLPTVRAERFWYVPMFGLATLVGLAFAALLRRTRERAGRPSRAVWRGIGVGVFVLLFGVQIVQARDHANDYVDDLAFWDACRKNATHSAKAHLNYSVMQGARKRNDERLAANLVAIELSPSWPMAHVYMGDALCHAKRAEESVPYYTRGFELGPNEASLIALGLQCLWEAKLLDEDSELLEQLEEDAAKHPGSWYAFLVGDLRAHGVEHKGVDPKYRPRGYNEGPK